MLLLIALLSLALSQCPTGIPLVETFNPSTYFQGQWYLSKLFFHAMLIWILFAEQKKDGKNKSTLFTKQKLDFCEDDIKLPKNEN